MSNLSRLRDNIAAIECALKGENNSEVLSKYTGFGGLGFILNQRGDKSKWPKSEQQYYDDTVRLYQMLVKNSKDGNEFSRWEFSLKQSTLTAFYTPMAITHKIQDALIHAHIDPKETLDPAAGMGAFVQVGIDGDHVTCYEKDLLTALMLDRRMKALPFTHHVKVVCDGFAD